MRCREVSPADDWSITGDRLLVGLVTWVWKRSAHSRALMVYVYDCDKAEMLGSAPYKCFAESERYFF